MSKRSYKQAFEHRFLNNVEVGDFYVKIDMYKVTSRDEYNINESYNITTTENNELRYGAEVIKKRSKSATAFDQEQTLTKTELTELFANISISDVWSAEYQTFDKTKEWQKELAETIQGLTVYKASDYVKKNFGSFGKVNRKIIGHKINSNSVNNSYIVRDLTIHFELLEEGVNVNMAERQSIRNLDVNSLQYLIFNGVKYVLK